MNAFYDDFAATAISMLTEFGADTQINRRTPGTYDPATGTTPVTVATLPTKCAAFPYGRKYIDGTLIRIGDLNAYMNPTPAVERGDEVVWQGKAYEVIEVEPLAPAGTVVLQTVQLRGR